jgi:hypothetical protein
MSFGKFTASAATIANVIMLKRVKKDVRVIANEANVDIATVVPIVRAQRSVVSIPMVAIVCVKVVSVHNVIVIRMYANALPKTCMDNLVSFADRPIVLVYVMEKCVKQQCVINVRVMILNKLLNKTLFMDVTPKYMGIVEKKQWDEKDARLQKHVCKLLYSTAGGIVTGITSYYGVMYLGVAPWLVPRLGVLGFFVGAELCMYVQNICR